MKDEIKNHIKNFSEYLKQLRKHEGLTQKQIAEKLGLAYQSYQGYELGNSLPTLEHFIELCHIFDVTANELLDMQ